MAGLGAVRGRRRRTGGRRCTTHRLPARLIYPLAAGIAGYQSWIIVLGAGTIIAA